MGAKFRAWTPEDDETLRKLHAEGLNSVQISRRMGFGANTIGRHCALLGLTLEGHIKYQMHDKRANLTRQPRPDYVKPRREPREERADVYVNWNGISLPRLKCLER